MSNVVFGHFVIDTNLGKKGNICVALQRPPRDSGSMEYRAAVAFGSPMDCPNRKLGRKIASERLNSDRPGRNFTFTCESRNFHDIFGKALQEASNAELCLEKNHQTVSYAPVWLLTALEQGNSFEPV